MSIMDDMKDKMGGMKDRMEELKNKEQAGELDDKDREELSQLRERFDKQ